MKSDSLKRGLLQLTALIVMLHLSVVQAMAASGEFHEQCHGHGHSHEPEHHECAVTLMLQGGYDRALPDIVPVEFIPEPPPPVALAVPKPRNSAPSHLAGGVLAHAPPRGP